MCVSVNHLVDGNRQQALDVLFQRGDIKAVLERHDLHRAWLELLKKGSERTVHGYFMEKDTGTKRNGTGPRDRLASAVTVGCGSAAVAIVIAASISADASTAGHP
ncbi:MAG: hypothetical protein M3Z35_02370 [Nitrospirota bacterium]|nr:hypothetical protein [Nitrospirota bacterium]